MKLSASAAAAVRYYQGDVAGNDPFWGDPKAYCTLNSLFFPGISNDTARSAEGKRLNPAFMEDIDRLAGLCGDLLGAFFEARSEREMLTYRVERLSDYLLCRELGRTVSFTSTSTNGFLRQYGDKKGLALLRFRIPAGTPCVNMADMLEYYAKAQEAEVLLPPYLALEFEELPLTGEEYGITDADGNPPAVSCLVTVHGIRTVPEDAGELTAEGAAAGGRVYEALNRGEIPDAEDAERYARWKCAFRNSVVKKMGALKSYENIIK